MATASPTSTAGVDRVIPLLCDEILKKSKPFQRLNLEAFLANFRNLERCLVLTSDAELLLALLFKLISRQPGISELDIWQTKSVALMALRVLHKLFTDLHTYFETFLTALNNIMSRLGLTDDNFYRRPVLAEKGGDTIRQLSLPANQESFVITDVTEELDGPREESQIVEEADFGDLVTLSAEDFYFRLWSKFHEDPNSVTRPQSTSTKLTMRDLYPLKAGFDDMDQNGSEMLSYSELRDFQESTGWEFKWQIWDEIDTDGDGLISFFDLMTAWFPRVDPLELQQKIAMLPSATEMKRRRQKAQMARERAEEKLKRQQGDLMTQFEWAQEIDDRRREEMYRKDDQKEDRWKSYCQTTVSRLSSNSAAENAIRSIPMGPLQLNANELFLDACLEDASLRPLAVELLTALDYSSVNICFFMDKPNAHLYVPDRFHKRGKVFRDFASSGLRPTAVVPWEGSQHAHIKTNIPVKSDIMYRIVVEGYNYGVNAPIHSDIVGYTHRRWNKLGAMEDFGWPQGWDQNTSNDYTKGALISQYISTDGFVVIKLTARSLLFAGFSVSAFLLNHGYGADFAITAEVIHSDHDL